MCGRKVLDARDVLQISKFTARAYARDKCSHGKDHQTKRDVGRWAYVSLHARKEFSSRMGKN